MNKQFALAPDCQIPTEASDLDNGGSATPEQTYWALDLEFNQPSRKIIQVGVALARPSQRFDEFITARWYLNPEEALNPEIVKLTGISDRDIQEHAVSVETCAAGLSELARQHRPFINPVVWGGGDARALLALFEAHAIHFPHFGRRDLDVKTMTTFFALSSPQAKASGAGGLRSVMGRYGIPFRGRAHQADVDAANTLQLMFTILKRQQRLEAAVRLLSQVK